MKCRPSARSSNNMRELAAPGMSNLIASRYRRPLHARRPEWCAARREGIASRGLSQRATVAEDTWPYIYEPAVP